MTWATDNDVQADGTLHVWPLHDTGAHVLIGVGCWCRPEIEEQPNGSAMVSHRDALDRTVVES